MYFIDYVDDCERGSYLTYDIIVPNLTCTINIIIVSDHTDEIEHDSGDDYERINGSGIV